MSGGEGESAGGRLAVAVHGAAGAVGAEIVSQLDVDSEVETVLAFDEGPPPQGAPPKVKFHGLGEDESFGAVLKEAGAKLAVYLAPFPAAASDQPDAVDDTAAFRRFLAGCEAAGVEGIAVASGSAIYGAHRDNPASFAEGAPLKPGTLLPGQIDLQRETLCADFARRSPATALAVCRLTQVVGRDVRGLMGWLLSSSKFMVVEGFDPPIQFVHVEDVGRSIFRLLKSRRTGIYNIAPDDYTSLLQLGRAFKKPLARLSPRMARVRTWIGSFAGGFPPAFLPLIQYPILLSNKKIKRDTGFAFKYGSEQALALHAKRATLAGQDA